MKTDKYYNRLIEIQKQYPKLTFDNNGYEYIRKELEEHKEVVNEINEILKATIGRFPEFNNFKPRPKGHKDGDFAVRCQYAWDSSFTGVGYFGINEFKNFEEDEK